MTVVSARDVPGTRFAPGERVIFVSDVHLHEDGGEDLEAFVGFLDAVRDAAPAALFVHGDLFEFYVGPRQGRTRFLRPLFEAFGRVAATGTRVFVQRGNRDYLIGRCFREVGAEVLPDRVRIDLGDEAAHLSHGDELCIHDRSYQFWARGVLRSWPFRLIVRNLPLSFAFWLARRYRRVSGRKKARFGNRSRLGTIVDGARDLARSDPARHIVCGHVHHRACTPLQTGAGESETLLWTTGAWEEGPNYLIWTGQGFEDRDWAPGAPIGP